jgi:hypothetical protein
MRSVLEEIDFFLCFSSKTDLLPGEVLRIIRMISGKECVSRDISLTPNLSVAYETHKKHQLW